jgi:L-threonylcarbamoyladenylate synthase
MNLFEKEIENAVAVLRKGHVILYPTDTIWGVGCDATNSKAVSRLHKIKKRKVNKSLINLVHSTAMLAHYVKDVPLIAFDLIRSASNPITIVYPGAKNLARNAIAADGSVAIRVSSNPFCIALVEAFGKPIASSSANLSGEPTPITFGQISDTIKQSVDYAVNLYLDEIKHTKASTIIKLEVNGEFTIIRH